MKVLSFSAALSMAICAATPVPAPEKSTPGAQVAPAAPAAPDGWRPSVRLILLPARLEETAETTQAEESKRVLNSGEYYVLLEDGRLQMVTYNTAALADADKTGDKCTNKPTDKSVDKSAKQQVTPAPAPIAQFQVEYFQFPGQPQQQKEQQSEQQKQQQVDFGANLQYCDVKPISAPLVLILKKYSVGYK